MALGTSEVSPLELAAAYTAFANGGSALRPLPIRATSGPNSEALTERLRATSVYVFSPQVAYLMTNLMQSVVDSGTAARLRGMGLKGAIAGKTGTTDDGWFVGYTPHLVCAAWVGVDDNSDLRMKASDVALPMWADFMKQVLELRPELGGDAFPRPGGIVSAEIDPTTGCLAGPESPNRRTEIFIAGTEPYSTCEQIPPDEGDLTSTLDEAPPTEIPTPEQIDSETQDVGAMRLEVCTKTGLIAGPDCPNTEKREFAVGTEPHERCRPEFHRQY
jgi:penicillin-binding protein 1B